MKTSVAPRAAWISVRRLTIAACTETSSAETGSSATITSGSLASARARDLEAAQHFRDRRVAAAGLAHDRKRLPAPRRELDVEDRANRRARSPEPEALPGRVELGEVTDRHHRLARSVGIVRAAGTA